jgi:very-short-patch-repair endonuclease
MLRFKSESDLRAHLGDRIVGARIVEKIGMHDDIKQQVAKKMQLKRVPNDPAALLAFQIKAAGLPAPEREFRFHPTRRWRLDLAFVDRKIAIELNGGIWMRNPDGTAGGAHSRPRNILRDMSKGNALQEAGWRLYQFTPHQVTIGEALKVMERVLRSSGEQGGEGP